MGQDRLPLQKVSNWSRRRVEWTLLVSLMVVVGLLFVREMRAVQGQTEAIAVQTTLGALRTALVIDHLQKIVSKTAPVAVAQRNPFELLQRRPANYWGELTLAEAALAPTGSWVFDPVCVCVGYVPMFAQIESPSGEVMLWFRVSEAPGPLQLTAKEAYVWHGQVMN